MGARTKGCITCKARKIKCSAEEPSCQQCRRSGIKCGGYGKFLRFVDEKPRIERRKNVEVAQLNELCKISTSTLSRNTNYIGGVYASNTLTKTMYGEILVSHLIMKLGNRRNCWGVGDPGSWLNEMLKIPHQSLDALAAVFYGRAYRLQYLVVASLRLYGGALTQMRRRLNDGERDVTFGILASITTLCMFELANSRSGDGWILHAQCLERLLDISGPPRKSGSPAEHSLFLIQRTVLISQSIVSRRRTILSQERWKTVPWAHDPASKKPFDFLLDILCDIADLRAEMNGSRTCVATEQHTNFNDKAYAIMANLNAWWLEWEEQNPGVCWEVATFPFTLLEDPEGPLYPTSLEYTNIEVAFIVCAHDSARILLLQVFASLGILSPPQLDVSNAVPKNPLLGISFDSVGLAHEIMRSTEYCSIQSGHFMGSFSAILILDIAYSVLAKVEGSRVARWLVKNSQLGLGFLETEFRPGKDIMDVVMLPTCQLASKSRFVED